MLEIVGSESFKEESHEQCGAGEERLKPGRRRQVTVYVGEGTAAKLSQKLDSETNETIITMLIRQHLGESAFPSFNPQTSRPKRLLRTRRPRDSSSPSRRGKVAISAWLPPEMVGAMIEFAKAEETSMNKLLASAADTLAFSDAEFEI